MDSALDVDDGASQQRMLCDWSTQLPTIEVTEEEAAQDEAQREIPEGHLFSIKDIPRCVQSTSKKIHVGQLQWDKTTVLGQIRPLNGKLVEHYVNRLKAAPPRRLVRILVKASRGMAHQRRNGVTNNTFISQMDTTFPWVASISLQRYWQRTRLLGDKTTKKEYQKQCNSWMPKFCGPIHRWKFVGLPQGNIRIPKGTCRA